MKRQNWMHHEHTCYGFIGEYGVGIYRYDPETWEKLEYWIDKDSCTQTELDLYNKYLEENGWDE